MKYWLLVWVLVSAGLEGRAQTFAEWFKQTSTRRKYYMRQVAALSVYLGELEKGYAIADEGLGTIGGGKQGEYDTHQGYYASLAAVNPALASLDEVTEIAALQAAMVQRFTDALARYRRDGVLGADRLAEVVAVFTGVVQVGLADVLVLTGLLTADSWQMTDDQRMRAIVGVDNAMRERYAVTLDYLGRTDLLEVQLAGERAGLGVVRAFYGVR